MCIPEEWGQSLWGPQCFSIAIITPLGTNWCKQWLVLHLLWHSHSGVLLGPTLSVDKNNNFRKELPPNTVGGPFKHTCDKRQGVSGSFIPATWRVPPSLQTALTPETASTLLCLYLVCSLWTSCLLVIHQYLEMMDNLNWDWDVNLSNPGNKSAQMPKSRWWASSPQKHPFKISKWKWCHLKGTALRDARKGLTLLSEFQGSYPISALETQVPSPIVLPGL